MYTQSTAAASTFRDLVASLPIVILARALSEAFGTSERRFSIGQPARA